MKLGDRFLAEQGFLKHIVESLVKDEEGLVTLLTKALMHYKYLYLNSILFISIYFNRVLSFNHELIVRY